MLAVTDINEKVKDKISAEEHRLISLLGTAETDPMSLNMRKNLLYV